MKVRSPTRIQNGSSLILFKAIVNVMVVFHFLSGCANPPANDPHLLLTSPFRVHWEESPDGPPTYLLVAEYGPSRVTISTCCGRFEAPPLPTATLRERLSKEYVCYKDGYLFLRADGGGGNSIFACVDHVFKLSDGRLKYIGYTAAGANAGEQFDGTFFRNRFGQLEGNALTDHADAPDFPIILREQNGAFHVDTEATWRAVLPDYQCAVAWLKQRSLGPRPPPQPDHENWAETPTVPALYCLALTKYCNRTNEYHATLALAAHIFPDLQPLLKEVRKVVPGKIRMDDDPNYDLKQQVNVAP